MGDDFPEPDQNLKTVDEDMKILREVGARLFRCGMSWLQVEPSKGAFHWRFWDMLAREAGKNGVTLIPYVCYTPEWAARSQDNFWRQPPSSPSLLAGFLEAAARRYRNQVRSWEIWNEPDNPDFWLGTPQDYAALVKAGAQGVRRGNPDATVVLGGLSRGASPFLGELLRLHALDRVDVVDLHGYAETWNQDTLEDAVYRIESLRRTTLAPGHTPDLWMAEMGYSSAQLRPGQGEYPLFYTYQHTPAYQAAALMKYLLLGLSTKELSLAVWYRIRDVLAAQGVIGDANNRSLGVVKVSGRPKPALSALELYSRLFVRPLRCDDAQVHLSGPRDAVLHAFQAPDGTLLICGWLPSPPAQDVAPASPGDDARTEIVQARLPGAGYKVWAVYDEQGRIWTGLPRRVGTWLMDLKLTGAHVLIVELKPGEQRL